MHLKREVKLAVTAISAVIILIWGINFLKAKALFDRNNVFYGMYDRVDGLKVSSSVVYRGYSVGQVTAIRFIGERFDKVLVEFSVRKKLGIPSNSVAAIQSADLMGSKSINLIPGDALQYAQSGDTLQSQLELGIMQQVNEQIAPLKKKAENVMSSLDTVLISLQEILQGEENNNLKSSLHSIGRTLNNVEQASGTLNVLLANEAPHVSAILGNLNSITGNLRKNNAGISRSLTNLTEISDSLRAVNLALAVRRFDHMLLQADSVLIKVNKGEGTLGGMVNDNNLYYNLTESTANLNKLLSEFRANPKRFVNLSVFDFTSNKISQDNYGIVVSESDFPFPIGYGLYREYPDLKEVRKGGKFLYLLGSYKKLKQAEKELVDVKKYFKDAYIVKLSQS